MTKQILLISLVLALEPNLADSLAIICMFGVVLFSPLLAVYGVSKVK